MDGCHISSLASPRQGLRHVDEGPEGVVSAMVVGVMAHRIGFTAVRWRSFRAVAFSQQQGAPVVLGGDGGLLQYR
jgi:hypothetical protein